LCLALLPIGVALLVASCTGRTPSSEAQGDAVVKEGQRLFEEQCASCHGQRGDRIPSAPLASKEFLESRRDVTLAAAIAQGKGVMPAWGKAREGPLTDEQIRSIVAYLNLAAGRTSPARLAGAGRSLFQEQCARCHGDKGDRVPVAPLASKEFLDSRSDTQLVTAIGEGVGVMPGFRQGRNPALSEEQVRAVVAYLRVNVDANVADRIHRGRDLYLAKCLSCHGERGDRTPSVSLAAPEYLRRVGEDTLATAISDGKGQMPGFVRAKGGTLSSEDVAALVAYLKAWAGLPADVALEGTGAPSTAVAGAAGTDTLTAHGKDLFGRSCAACHGANGSLLPNANLADGAWLQQRGDAALTETISDGKGIMPGLGSSKGGPLSPDDIAAILAYLKSLAGIAESPAVPDSAPALAAAPVAVTARAATATQPGPTDDAVVARGADLYRSNCSACHGDSATRMGRLADGAWLRQRGDRVLARSIVEGKSVPGAPGAMPPFGKAQGGALSDDDVLAVVAYLKSVAGVPLAVDTDDVGGAADVVLGKDLYAKSCAACHGVAGNLMPTASLADAGWLRQRGDAALTEAISAGKGTMPGLGKERGGPLGPDDIAAILAYLKSLAGVAPSGS
jgi:mono/diheme cytochrome c family protein